MLEIGKLPPQLLEQVILNPIQNNHKKRKEILIRPKMGEDCSGIFLGDEICVVSTDPITGAQKDIGYLAVHINCNDIAASGAEPIGILLTLLLPDKSTEEDLKEIMKGAYEAAEETNIEIIGGHTEVTKAVNQPLISAAVIGKTKNKKFISSGGAKIGQDVLMTKWAGLEGTAILAKEHEQNLKKKINKDLIESAKNMKGFLSVIEESKIAFAFGATALHDATEGGILGAVWEVADCSNTGIEIYKEKIPIKEETKQICEAMGISAYSLISSGTLVITAFEGEKLVEQLKKAGIESSVIGKITEGGKKIIEEKGAVLELKQPKSDEIYFARLK